MNSSQLVIGSERRGRAGRVAVTEAPPAALGPPDYADAFQVGRRATDGRSAESWARAGFDGLPTAARRAALFIHRRIFGFDLGEWDSPDHVFGWRIVSSEPELLHLEAHSRLMSGRMLWRLEADTLTMTTFVRYGMRRAAPTIWAVLGNVHRGGAPGLLTLAARASEAG